MLIDLHCHTKSVKKGDGPNRDVTKELFCEKIANANVKIVAITNHNTFDLKQYNEFKDAVKDFCQLWPGVEIDIHGKNKWHLIVVANPDNVDSFSTKVNDLFNGKDLDKCSLSIDEVYDTLNNCDVIYIPHYHKNKGIEEDDRLYMEQLIKDESRIIFELSNHRSLGVHANNGIRSLVGSDVKDWNSYEDCTFADLKLPVESFQQFCLLTKRDKTIVETLLNKKQSVTLMAKPHQTVTIPLKLYQDVNVVFGPKGTGKTEIIKSLYEDMLSHGVSCEKYIASDKGEDFKSLLSNKGMERDLSIVGADSCEDAFNTIRKWKDTTPTDFKLYVEWYLTKEDSANKKTMKITEASSLQFMKTKTYEEHKKDKELVNEIIKSINQIDLQDYLNEEDSIKLTQLIEKLLKCISHSREIDLIDEYSIELVNKTLSLIKTLADRNSDTVSKPSETGFATIAKSRLELLNAVNKIIDTLALQEKINTTILGTLEGKGDIYIASRYRFFCEDSHASEFDRKYGYKKLEKIITDLRKIQKNMFSPNLAVEVKELAEELDDCSIHSIKPFLGIEKYIVDSENKPYTLSNGEESILLLQKSLSKDADAYFLDEPELGMGNSYIDLTIRPLISKLAKQRKYIVIATHNANIAVRTLPYMSILRTHYNGIYSTYCGNPFNDLLVNIDDESDVKSWSSESLHYLEGSEEAFYERKGIYESKNN